MTESPLDAARKQIDDSQRSGGNRTLLLALGALVAVAVLAAIAITALGGSDDVAEIVPGQFGGVGAAEVGPVSVAGAVLPPFSSDTTDTAIGSEAPVVTASSLIDGESIEMGPGRARIIGFFAHWCPHCQREIPELTTWLGTGALPDGVEFIGVSTVVAPDRDNYPPADWFNAERWPAQVVVDDANASLLSAYGFTGFPAFIAIDEDGVVVDRIGGNVGTAGFDRLADALG